MLVTVASLLTLACLILRIVVGMEGWREEEWDALAMRDEVAEEVERGRERGCGREGGENREEEEEVGPKMWCRLSSSGTVLA